MTPTRTIAVLAACAAVVLAGCDAFSQEFKKSFEKEYIASCSNEAGGDKEVTAFCVCMGKSLVKQRSVAELTEMGVNVPTEAETIKMAKELGCDDEFATIFRVNVVKGCVGEAPSQRPYCECFAEAIMGKFDVEELSVLDQKSPDELAAIAEAKGCKMK